MFCGKEVRKVKAQYTETADFGHHVQLLHNVTYSIAGQIGQGRHMVYSLTPLTHKTPCKSLKMGSSSDRAADSRKNARLKVIKFNHLIVNSYGGKNKIGFFREEKTTLLLLICMKPEYC